MIDDLYDVFDRAIRTGYLPRDAITVAPIWRRLPYEIKSAMTETLAAGEWILPQFWQARNRLLGKPVRSIEQSEWNAAVMIGLYYLRYLEGRLDIDSLLKRAFHVADSYICEIDAVPFVNLRHDLLQGNPDEGRVAALFAPHLRPASECVERWGLRADGLKPGMPLYAPTASR